MNSSEQFELPMAVGLHGQHRPRLVLLPATWLSQWGVFPPPAKGPAKARPIQTTFYAGTPKEYMLEIGGFSLMGPLQDPEGKVRNNPTWSIDHLRVFAALLTFVSPRYHQPEVDISWRALYLRMGMETYPNAKTRTYWRSVCVDVLVTYYRVRSPGATAITTAPIARNKFVKILFQDGVTSMGENIRGLTFAPEFLAALWPGIETGDRTEVRDLDQTAFASFRFPLSRLLYLVLGCHAAFRTRAKPYQRTVPGLLGVCGWPVAEIALASKRLRALTGRDGKGVLTEIDGTSLLNGILRVEVRKSLDWMTRSGNAADWDYIVCVWCEGRTEKNEPLRPDRAATHYLAKATGLDVAAYLTLCRRAGRQLSEVDIAQLTAAGFHDWKKSEVFLARVKSFIGVSRFHEEIGDTKMHRDSGRPFSKSPSARIIADLMRATESVAASRLLSLRL